MKTSKSVNLGLVNIFFSCFIVYNTQAIDLDKIIQIVPTDYHQITTFFPTISQNSQYLRFLWIANFQLYLILFGEKVRPMEQDEDEDDKFGYLFGERIHYDGV